MEAPCSTEPTSVGMSDSIVSLSLAIVELEVGVGEMCRALRRECADWLGLAIDVGRACLPLAHMDP